jgi:NDP-sugar pyrophosphorylase family protein
MYPVMILAGGLATRLRPITESIPKALVSVNGKPFINYQLEYLKQQGITKVILCVGYLGQLVEEYVGDGSGYGLEVHYSYDGEQYLGTGGALRKALPLVDSHFFVLYGDSFLPIDFKAVQNAYDSSDELALMTVLKNQNQWDKSNVVFKGTHQIDYNKSNPTPSMNYIDYGLLVMSSKIFKTIPENVVLDLAEILHQLSLESELVGMKVYERFYEIGSFQGLKETEEFFIKRMNHELLATTFE